MEIVITIKIEDGKQVKVDVKQTETETAEEFSQYARFFDETSPRWSKNTQENWMFLRHQENYANEKLMSVGYLFLNDAYEMLGIPRSKIGQVVGWTYDAKDPTGGKIVDFGLTKEHNSKFVNGYKRTILLDFNVQRNILDDM